MDAVGEPGTDTVVFIKCAQVGATEILGNIAGYHVHHDPAPILVIQPNVKPMGEAWSRDRLAPMIRDTPALAGRVADPKSRDAANTILHKVFPGGHITVAGANSPAGLASRPIRIVLGDELDRWEVTKEGDPLALATERTATFWNRKRYLCSTPTRKGVSRIERLWEGSDQRRYMVPCPACGAFDHLRWGQVKWGKDEHGAHDTDGALYECPACGERFDLDAHKPAMLAAGRWKATAPGPGKAAGFHLNKLYSPWVTLPEIVRAFLAAKSAPDLLRVWVNTTLGETFAEKGDAMEEGPLIARREHYAAPVPAGAVLLTCAVDVQGDRLECLVVGWGPGEESWDIEHRVIYGNPARKELWDRELDDFLLSRFAHESGLDLPITAVGIDSGGHHTEQVYDFCRPRFARHVFALKGSSQPGAPLVGRPSRNNLGKVHLFPIGTNAAKDTLFGRLSIEAPGEGRPFVHFPHERGEEYFKQLTAEHRLTFWHMGQPVQRWVLKKPGSRNEIVDLWAYNVAVKGIINPNLPAFAAHLEARLAERDGQAPPPAMPTTPRRRQISKGL